MTPVLDPVYRQQWPMLSGLYADRRSQAARWSPGSARLLRGAEDQAKAVWLTYGAECGPRRESCFRTHGPRKLATLPVQSLTIVTKPIAAIPREAFRLRNVSPRRAGAVVMVHSLRSGLLEFVDRVKRRRVRHWGSSEGVICDGPVIELRCAGAYIG